MTNENFLCARQGTYIIPLYLTKLTEVGTPINPILQDSSNKVRKVK